MRVTDDDDQSVLDSLLEPLAVLDQYGIIERVNAAWRQFGWRNGSPHGAVSPIGVSYLRICEKAGGTTGGDERAAAAAGISAVMIGRRFEFHLDYPCHSAHEQRWFRMTVTRLRGPTPKVVVCHRNMTAIKRSEIAAGLTQSMLHQIAEEDPLTGLANRLVLIQRLAKLAERNRVEPAFRYALLFLELDRYELVSDVLGHEPADAMHVMLAQRLRAAQAAGSFVARFGGYEFVYVASGIDDASAAYAVAARLQAVLSAPYRVHGYELPSTVSIGIAVTPPQPGDPDELLRNGTLALHEAKRTGPGFIKMFEPVMHERLARRLQDEVAA